MVMVSTTGGEVCRWRVYRIITIHYELGAAFILDIASTSLSTNCVGLRREQGIGR